MNTIEDFQNAPFGATATDPQGRRAVKTFNERNPWRQDVDKWTSCSFSEEKLVESGFTLDPAPAPAPTTVQEALDLAWELACPVKEGQHIPEGTRLLDRSGRNDLSAYSTQSDFTINARESLSIRTLDPLPDPEPDWLDAPAVLARGNDWVSCADPQVFVRENKDGTRWVRDTRFYRWDELTDVVPLYPKEDQ